jgi:FkbM family methyltransferase
MTFPLILVSIISRLPQALHPVRIGRFFGAVFVKCGFSEWIVVKHEGVIFQLSLLCRTSAGQIWRGGNHGDEIDMFSKVIKPQSAFIDIGANVGLVSIPLASKLQGIKCIAVEPIEQNVSALIRNVSLNLLEDSFTVVPFALGDEIGEVKILRDRNFGGSTGNAKIVRGVDGRKASHNAKVELLDNIWRDAGSPCVSFIKIDVEGYEYHVLNGGKELINSCRPVIYGEFHNVLMPKNGHTFLDVYKLFESSQYVVCQFRSDNTLTVVDNPTPSTGNAFLVPSERLGDLPLVNL